MDLLDPRVPLDLSDPSWHIYTRSASMPPHFVSKDAECQNSLIAEGCVIEGSLEFAVLFAGVKVEKGARVTDSIIMPGATIKAGATVQYAIVAEDAVIEAGAVVGQRPENVQNKDEWGIAVIGNGVTVGEGAVIPAKAMIDEDVPAAKR